MYFQNGTKINDIRNYRIVLMYLEGGCNFQTGFCGWYNAATGDDFDWIVHAGSTSSSATGPMADHNGNTNGKYLYIETSSPRRPGDAARLIRTITNSSGAACFSFWYHMYGSTVERLNVYVQTGTQNSNSTMQLRWRLIGNQGDVWNKAAVNLGNVNGNITLIIEGVTGNSYTGDIAIDDFEVKQQYCTTMPSKAAPTMPTTTSSKPPTTTSAASSTTVTLPSTTTSTSGKSSTPFVRTLPGGCNFQTGFCGWYNAATGDDFDWIVHAGSTSSSATGPMSGPQRQYKRPMQSQALVARQQKIHNPICSRSNKSRRMNVDLCLLLEGKYLYIETSSPRRPGDAARLIRTITNSSGAACFSFWYHMYGSTVERLNVYVQTGTQNSNSTMQLRWRLIGNQGDVWNKAAVNLGNVNGNITLIIEGVTGNSYTGDIAIDDFEVKQQYCTTMPSKAAPTMPTTTSSKPPTTTSAASSTTVTLPSTTTSTSGKSSTPFVRTLPGGCNFQTGFCGWYNAATGDDFDWIVHAGSTSSSATGPMTDHNGNTNGKYLYIETSSPRRPGDAARLIRTITNSSGAACFSFWYHMYGSTVERLNVYVQTGTQNSNSTMQLRWRLIGNQGDVWNKAAVNLGNVNGNITLIIEGVTGNSYTGDIAIDDFEVKQQYCTTMPSKAAPTMPTTTSSKPPTTTSAASSTTVTLPSTTTSTSGKSSTPFVRTLPGGCNFQTGFCGWYNAATGDDFDWIVHAGSTSSSATGPMADHNGNTNGKYLYIETSSPRRPGDAARLIRTITNSSGAACFSFWYHMYGSTVERLNVYVQTGTQNSNSTMQLRWRLIGNQGDVWNKAAVNLGNVNGNITLIIEGVTGNSYTGDIAIDDFEVKQQYCTTMPSKAAPTMPTTTSSKPPTTTSAASSTTVTLPSTTTSTSGKSWTPFVRTLPGGCNFQTGFCGWYNAATGDDFDWIVHAGSTSSSATGPRADHNGNTNGKYLYLEASSPRRNFALQRNFALLERNFTGSAQIVCFRFWFHMFGSDIGSLKVYATSSSRQSRHQIWQKMGNQGDTWHQGSIPVPVSAVGYLLSIEGEPGSGFKGGIAIDDFKFIEGACSTIPTTSNNVTSTPNTGMTVTTPIVSSTMQSTSITSKGVSNSTKRHQTSSTTATSTKTSTRTKTSSNTTPTTSSTMQSTNSTSKGVSNSTKRHQRSSTTATSTKTSTRTKTSSNTTPTTSSTMQSTNSTSKGVSTSTKRHQTSSTTATSTKTSTRTKTSSNTTPTTSSTMQSTNSTSKGVSTSTKRHQTSSTTATSTKTSTGQSPTTSKPSRMVSTKKNPASSSTSSGKTASTSSVVTTVATKVHSERKIASAKDQGCSQLSNSTGTYLSITWKIPSNFEDDSKVTTNVTINFGKTRKTFLVEKQKGETQSKVFKTDEIVDAEIAVCYRSRCSERVSVLCRAMGKSKSGKATSNATVIATSAGGFIALVLIIVVVLFFVKRARTFKRRTEWDEILDDGIKSPFEMEYNEENISLGFSNELYNSTSEV
eukprot:gene9222-16904_t